MVLTGLFSLGVVLVSRQDGYVSQLQDMLFGRLLTVTAAQFWQILIVALVSIGIVAVTWRAQLYRSFDPDGFVASGFRILRTDLWLSIAVALLVVAGVQALGVLMVVALLTVPMATSRLITERFALLIPIAIAVPLVAGFFGLWGSFSLSVGADARVSPGSMVVLLLVGLYLVAAMVRLGILHRRPATRPASARETGTRQTRARRAAA